ncbi:hypothetical protein HGG75_25275 [Ochrobactrum pseudogrignonense]|nr:hypothetical protein [Brucella pseudogrignonensis]
MSSNIENFLIGRDAIACGEDLSGAKRRRTSLLASVSINILASVASFNQQYRYFNKVGLVTLGVMAAPMAAHAHTDSLGYILSPVAQMVSILPELSMAVGTPVQSRQKALRNFPKMKVKSEPRIL